jgi:methylthioribose-1-phosphate isomerase
MESFIYSTSSFCHITRILVKDVDHMVEIIQMLKVRGAPAIGISAGLALAQFSKGIDERDKVRELALKLRASRV